MKTIFIHGNANYITLGQLLKRAGVIGTGGQAKFFLKNTAVWVNGTAETRRGKKLHEGDRIKIDGAGEFLIARS
ncbi:MAG: S4 domain-containing protein YaaA [Sporolactobacillus sp.]|jgi:S4 domain protein YaaA|nr:S4 domain-containing protein YaaA [Sporolactobacillus sp.]MCI1882948.1 S4 domain-containing protein YaaA [Sporolactobacillus sp.]